MELAVEEVVEPAPEAERPEDELVDPRPLPGGERGGGARPGEIEPPAPLHLTEESEGEPPAGAHPPAGPSSIPSRGELGTAVGRAGIRPAR